MEYNQLYLEVRSGGPRGRGGELSYLSRERVGEAKVVVVDTRVRHIGNSDIHYNSGVPAINDKRVSRRTRLSLGVLRYSQGGVL